jgi:fructose-1,6-bisphosphatase I
MFTPDELVSAGQIITIERHVLEGERQHPGATGALTNLLYDIALAGKVIASQTTRAGLAQILGRAGETNVQGEDVMKLDILADRTIYRLNDHTGRLAVMASEEHEGLLHIPEGYPTGKYVLLFDPLDGSSNIDYTIPVGTIFGIYHRKSADGPGTMEDCIQPGRALVAAGYLIYGSSTMLVYTTGDGVHGFTLDPLVGEFLLSHPGIRIPKKPKYYSANQGYQLNWSDGVQRYTRYIQGDDGGPKGMSLRYIGSLVADFHRNLLAGGVFFYPGEAKKPEGKLRLLYEANPLAFIAEQAGGYASNGKEAILDIEPKRLHQRTPLFIGNTDLVKKAEEYIAQYE